MRSSVRPGGDPASCAAAARLPIMPLLERLGIPAVVTGFDTPDGNIHAPNERMRVENLALSIAAARELFLSLAEL